VAQNVHSQHFSRQDGLGHYVYSKQLSRENGLRNSVHRKHEILIWVSHSAGSLQKHLVACSVLLMLVLLLMI
jgi:hypothetical protein